MAKHAKAVLLIGALGISVSAILTRFSNAPSMVLALYRMAMAALCLLPVVLCKHREELKKLDKKTWLVSLLGGVFLACHFTCYFEGVYRTSVAAATILCNTQVFFAAILTVLLFREKLSKQCLAAIGLTFLGGVLIALSSTGDGSALSGNLLALASAVFMACYEACGRVCRKSDLSTNAYTFIVYSAAALTLLLVCAFTKTPALGYDRINFLTAAGMVAFCTFLGHSIFNWGLKYETQALVATIQSLEPVGATLWAVLVFREIPSLTVLLGGLVVIGGVALHCKYANT